MKNPTLFMQNITREQAEEVMDYLYYLYCEHNIKSRFTEINGGVVTWIYNGEVIAKWTEEYKNIMISKDFIKKAKQA